MEKGSASGCVAWRPSSRLRRRGQRVEAAGEKTLLERRTSKWASSDRMWGLGTRKVASPRTSTCTHCHPAPRLIDSATCKAASSRESVVTPVAPGSHKRPFLAVESRLLLMSPSRTYRSSRKRRGHCTYRPPWAAAHRGKFGCDSVESASSRPGRPFRAGASRGFGR